MIKQLFLAAALLVPGVTYAANPSTVFSVQVVPAGSSSIACDKGPNYTGAIPAGAQAAGFTHCAANYDFTAVGGPYSNPATYINCKGASTPSFYNASPGIPGNSNCNYLITTDGSVQVLDIQWKNTFLAQCQQGSPGNGNSCYMYLMTGTQSLGTGNIAASFPNAYYEVTYRVTPTVADSTSVPLSAFWSWGAQGNAASVNEYDFFETYGANLSGQYDAAWHNYNGHGSGFVWNGATGNIGSGYDPTQYHKYAGLITSNGSTITSFCSYVDNVKISKCQNVPVSSPAYTQRQVFILQNGQGTAAFTNTVDMYVQAVRVWSCPTWQTTMCNGTVIYP